MRVFAVRVKCSCNMVDSDLCFVFFNQFECISNQKSFLLQENASKKI